jgi:hypothetical protein
VKGGRGTSDQRPSRQDYAHQLERANNAVHRQQRSQRAQLFFRQLSGGACTNQSRMNGMTICALFFAEILFYFFV